MSHSLTIKRLLFASTLSLSSWTVSAGQRFLLGDQLSDAVQMYNDLSDMAMSASNVLKSTSQKYPVLGRNLRGGESSKKGKKKGKKGQEECEARVEELETELELFTTPPSLLVVQLASNCVLRRMDDGSHFISTDSMQEMTYAFSDRPMRFEEVLDTSSFFASFPQSFANSAPNAAVTLVSEDQTFKGPLVAVFLTAVHTQETGTFVYEIGQSAEQEEALPLDDFYTNGSDAVTFSYCSFFVDGWIP